MSWSVWERLPWLHSIHLSANRMTILKGNLILSVPLPKTPRWPSSILGTLVRPCVIWLPSHPRPHLFSHPTSSLQPSFPHTHKAHTPSTAFSLAPFLWNIPPPTPPTTDPSHYSGLRPNILLKGLLCQRNLHILLQPPRPESKIPWCRKRVVWLGAVIMGSECRKFVQKIIGATSEWN